MSKKFIRGKFFYEDEEEQKKKSKKQRRKEELKALKLKDKEIAKQCECNHLDRKKNKTHFKKSDDGNYVICKICGGHIISNPDLLTKEAVEAATETIYSVFARVRNRMNISEEMDEKITDALRINSRAADLVKMLQDEHYSSKKKDKKGGKHGKKDKKNKNKKFSRINY